MLISPIFILVLATSTSAKSTTPAFSFKKHRNRFRMTLKKTILQSEEATHATCAPPNDYISEYDRYGQLKDIIKYATLAPSSHNTQCWKFKISLGKSGNKNDDYGSITVLPDFSRRCPVVDPDDHHLYVSLGCAVENMVIAARAYYGLDATVDASNPGGEDGGIHVTFTPSRTATIDDKKIQSLFEAIPNRQSTRCEYDGKSLKQHELELLQNTADFNMNSNDGGKNGKVRVILLTESSSLDVIREFVVEANTAQVENEHFVDELMSWLRFNGKDAMKYGDGLSSAVAGSPSLPGWMGRCIFPLIFRTNPENQKFIKQIDSSSGIAIFVSLKDDPVHWVETGRCYERFTLRATALDILNSMPNKPV